VKSPRACELSALFAPVALTRDIFLLVLRAAPAKPAEKERKWPAKQARIQGKEIIHKPCEKPSPTLTNSFDMIHYISHFQYDVLEVIIGLQARDK
jgi:hypothetical protein